MTILVYATNSSKDIDLLISKGKKNFLMSYYYLKSKSEDKLISLFSSLEGEYEIFMLDSGAFSAWNSGSVISLFEYIDFIKKYCQYFTHVICLDVIDNPILSEVNYLIMMQELKGFDLTVIPVFHSGEPFSVLDYMVKKEYKYLGISPNNSWQEKRKNEWLTRVFSRYDFEKLGIKTHALGYQSVRGLLYFPFTSTDAITWRIGASYGHVINPDLSLRYSNRAIHDRHINDLPGGSPDFVINLCNELNIDISELRDSTNARTLFNLEALDRIVASDKKVLDSTSIDLFEFYNAGFSEKEVLAQLEICLKMGREYKGNLGDIPARYKSKKKVLIKEEKLF